MWVLPICHLCPVAYSARGCRRSHFSRVVAKPPDVAVFFQGFSQSESPAGGKGCFLEVSRKCKAFPHRTSIECGPRPPLVISRTAWTELEQAGGPGLVRRSWVPLPLQPSVGLRAGRHLSGPPLPLPKTTGTENTRLPSASPRVAHLVLKPAGEPLQLQKPREVPQLVSVGSWGSNPELALSHNTQPVKVLFKN